MNAKMVEFMKSAIEVFPGWVETMDKFGIDKINYVSFGWRLMPKTYAQAQNLLIYGHPRGVEGAIRERKHGVQ
jgi:hypothetical protein